MGLDCASQVAALTAHYFEAHVGVQYEPLVLKRSWQRYLDDGFFVWLGCEAELAVFASLLNTAQRTPCGHCKFEYVFKCSSTEAVFLDMKISKAERWRRNQLLDVELYMKPSNPQAFIPSSSNHSEALARSWVRQEAKRRVTHHTCPAKAMDALSQFAQKIISRGYSGNFWRRAVAGVEPANRHMYLGLHAKIATASKQPERYLTFCAPYQASFISHLRHVLKIPEDVQKHLDAKGIRIAMTNCKTLLASIRG